MTEEEWLNGNLHSRVGLAILRQSHRKVRLFGIACCLQVLNEQSDSLLRQALLRAEDFADGRIGDSAREKWRRSVTKAHLNIPMPDDDAYPYDFYAVEGACGRDGSDEVGSPWCRMVEFYHSRHPADPSYVLRAEQLADAYLRDIFGNPFRPVTFDPAWRTSTAVGVAETIYADRTFGNLPILADALQDAGCDHPDILTHLRGPGPHVRGCWVVDLVLGKV